MSASADHSNPTPFTGALVPGTRPALLLIDLVRAYFEPGAPFFLGSDDALQSSERLLISARNQGIPVLHTRVAFTPGSLDGGVFMRKVPQLEVFSGDNPLGQFMPQVEPRDNEPVIVKQYASAFFGSSLASTLHASGVDTVVIGGVSTSGCVRASAVDSLQNGFITLVVRDAVGDREPGTHEANLHDIQAKYGEVISEAQALDYFERTSSASEASRKGPQYG